MLQHASTSVPCLHPSISRWRIKVWELFHWRSFDLSLANQNQYTYSQYNDTVRGSLDQVSSEKSWP